MKIDIVSTQTGFVLIFVLLLIPIVYVNAQQSNCSKVLDQAQNLYYEGKFEESMNLVKSCMASEELTKDESRQAYKIMSQVELARGDREKAKENIHLLLQVDPAYQPTIEQETPTYVQLVESVRSEIVTAKKKDIIVKKESGGISKWWYYSAGAVVAGTAYILLNNDESKKKDKPLDTPPSWDDN